MVKKNYSNPNWIQFECIHMTQTVIHNTRTCKWSDVGQKLLSLISSRLTGLGPNPPKPNQHMDNFILDQASSIVYEDILRLEALLRASLLKKILYFQ